MPCRCGHDITNHYKETYLGVENQPCLLCGCVDYSEVETSRCDHCGKVIEHFDNIFHQCPESIQSLELEE